MNIDVVLVRLSVGFRKPLLKLSLEKELEKGYLIFFINCKFYKWYNYNVSVTMFHEISKVEF